MLEDIQEIMVRKTCWWDVSPEHAYKHPNWLISKGPYCGYRSLFPLLPLRVKCQNHEKVPISPISPILVVHVLTRWKDMEDRTLSWFLHLAQGKRWDGPYFPLPLRVKCQNHERVPISPIAPKGEVPKPWEGPYFPYFGGPCLFRCQDIDHENRGNRGNRDPLMVLALHP